MQGWAWKVRVKAHLSTCLFLSLILIFTVTSITKCLNGENIGALSQPANLHVNVERKITLLSGGYMMINDTFLLSQSMEGGSKPTLVTSYVVGMPKNYSERLVYYRVFNHGGSLPVKILEDELFWWLNVTFPEPVDLSVNKAYNFTVMLVLSDLISRKTASIFSATFPLYPSLTHEALSCNVTLILPSSAKVSENDYPTNIFVNKTGDFRVLNNITSPLPPYSNISSWIKFSDVTFRILKFLELRREISIDVWGKISAIDFYEIEAANVYSVDIILPLKATDIVVYDAYGKYSKADVRFSNESYGVVVKIYLSEKLRADGRIKIAVSYALPPQNYLVKDGWQNYVLKINLIRPDEWVIYKVALIVTLPEGASLIQVNEPITRAQGIRVESVSPFQERVFVEYHSVVRFEDVSINVSYQYMVFWAGLRPTLLAAAIVGSAIILFLLAKSSAHVGIPSPTPVSVEILRKFIEVCEEKNRIMSEMESLEEQSARGKISRRQYRLMRKNLEGQLSSVQKSFLDLKAKMEAAGRTYANMIKRLEEAEAEIEVMKRSISEVEVRYRRGEISAETRRSLLEDYRRRIDRAESVRDEILLRLKEEIL